MIRIQRTVEIEAPAAEVWRIVGHEFDRIGDWATPVPASGAKQGEAVGEAPVAGRVCETAIAGFPALTETLTDYDEAGRTLEFAVTEGMPGFVTDARNRYVIESDGERRSRVRIDGRIEVEGVLGRLMSPVLRFNLSRAIDQSLEDITDYAETGEISERKRRSLDKHGAAALDPTGG